MIKQCVAAVALGCGCPAAWAEPDPTVVESQIRTTLDAMSAAALAGEGGAYLEHIADDEPEFLVEQQAWARDLARVPPGVLVYELAGRLEMATDAVALVPLRITWNSPNWDGGDRSIAMDARFVLDKGGSWDFAGRAWNELDAEGLRVLYVDGLRPQAEAAVEFWPEVKRHVETGFERRLDHPQVVKLYTDMRELQFSIFPAYTEPLGGWNEPGESIKLIAGDFGPGYLKTVLAHEYGHAITFAMGPDDLAETIEIAHDLPWWVAEGTAELAALKFSGGWDRIDRTVRAWHRAETLIGWGRITDFYETDPADYGYVYIMGCHMVGYLSDRFGRTARNAWINAMMNGMTLDAASREAFGVPFAELDADWRASIAQNED